MGTSQPGEQPISQPSMEAIKAGMRTTWMAGDFGIVAKTVSSGAEAFAARLPIASGQRVLDVATGTGNLALPIARCGAIVTGVDIASNLLIQARERAAAERLSIRFDEGDAEQLPYDDASFDVVVSMFGAMFAPRPDLVASEVARVLKPGGVLAMANWTPGGFTGRMFRMGAKHVPPVPGLPPPVMWGDETTARARLEPFFTEIRTEAIPIDFDMPTSPAGAVEFFRKYFGPTRMAFAKLDTTGQQAMHADLVELWSSANVAHDPANHTLVPNEYLEVVCRRRLSA